MVRINVKSPNTSFGKYRVYMILLKKPINVANIQKIVILEDCLTIVFSSDKGLRVYFKFN